MYRAYGNSTRSMCSKARTWTCLSTYGVLLYSVSKYGAILAILGVCMYIFLAVVAVS